MALTFALVPTLATAALAAALALALAALSVSLFPALLRLLLAVLLFYLRSLVPAFRFLSTVGIWSWLFALRFLAAKCWPSAGYRRCQTSLPVE